MDMAIEVRELVVKARIEDPKQNTPLSGGAQSSTQSSLTGRDLQKIISMCTEEVLKVLKRKNER